MQGRGGGQVVSVLAFYSDNPSSNPADAYSFSVQIVFEKNENKQKEAGVGPFLKKKKEKNIQRWRASYLWSSGYARNLIESSRVQILMPITMDNF